LSEHSVLAAAHVSKPEDLSDARYGRVIRSLGLLGVPSSAAAHWPGQEKAPAALREAGLVRLLRDAGSDIIDYGDRAVVRWRPHAFQRRPHNLSQVLEVLADARERIGRIFAAGQLPVVLGGECTLTIALVSAALDVGRDIALIYFDGGPDLRTPADNPTGVLDSMGVAHLLDLPGAAPELAGVGPRRPLLTADRVCFLGQSSGPPDGADATIEDRRLASLASRRLGVAEVAQDPRAAAEGALAAVSGLAEQYLVHFDVDVTDFYAVPIADVPQHNTGLTLDDTMAALAVLVGQPGFAGLTITEFNPDHGEPDGSTARVLATAIAAALSAGT
jgi:arginase